MAQNRRQASATPGAGGANARVSRDPTPVIRSTVASAVAHGRLREKLRLNHRGHGECSTM
ncbi:MAG: hypothetical protein ABIZ83_16410 [Casimicrobium sp.]